MALLVVALLAANVLNVAADLAAVGQGMQLLHLGSDHYWAIVTGLALIAGLVYGSFERIARIFTVLCLALLLYVGVLLLANVDWGAEFLRNVKRRGRS